LIVAAILADSTANLQQKFTEKLSYKIVSGSPIAWMLFRTMRMIAGELGEIRGDVQRRREPPQRFETLL
jgi:hypothetical protein